MKQKYSLGLLPEQDDTRDVLMGSILPPSVSLPVKIDCRDELPPIMHQRSAPTCVGFAAAAMKSGQECRDWLTSFAFSPRWIFEEANKIDGIPGKQGTTIRAAMKILKNKGVCLEESWKYNPVKPGKPKLIAEDQAMLYRISGYAKLESQQEMMNSLIVNGPFVIGISITHGWYSVKDDGVIKKPRHNAKSHGGHAVLVVGFNRIDRIWIIRNSWGEQWGDGGYAWIGFDHIEEKMITAWSAFDAITNE